jgi:aryl-alcohol dehydrogenase-like predicted oxidoreductase
MSTDIHYSMKLVLGTVQYGMDYGTISVTKKVSTTELKRIFSAADSCGIHHLDTSQSYGESEERIGRYSSSKFNIITKLAYGMKSSDIRNSIDLSIRLLGDNNLSGVLFHDFNDFLRDPLSIGVLNDLKAKGVIEKIGFSLYHTRELDVLLNEQIDFDILQIPFNIYDQRFKKYFEHLKSIGIEIYARSVFLQGLVFINPVGLPPHFSTYKDHFMQLIEISTYRNIPISELCLNFVCTQNNIDKVIIGVKSEKELINNVASIKKYSQNFQEVQPELEALIIDDENIILPINWN